MEKQDIPNNNINPFELSEKFFSFLLNIFIVGAIFFSLFSVMYLFVINDLFFLAKISYSILKGIFIIAIVCFFVSMSKRIYEYNKRKFEERKKQMILEIKTEILKNIKTEVKDGRSKTR